MTHDKAIEHGKEHRKQYRGPKAVDRSCRNHSDCAWCESNRTRRDRRRRKAADEQLKEAP